MEARINKYYGQLSNAFTNVLHASALGLYCYWIYTSPENDNPHILSVFVLFFIAKYSALLLSFLSLQHSVIGMSSYEY